MMKAEQTERKTGSGHLRSDLKTGGDGDLRRRRWIIGLSLVGAGAMAAVTLFQTGIVRHLPDPPLPNFDSDRVTTSDVAYALGGADAAVSLASLAANVPAAAAGDGKRAENYPLIPLGFAAKSLIEAAAASWFFYRMSFKEKNWCAYCIVNAAAIWGVALLALPEAKRAWSVLRDSGRTSFDNSGETEGKQ